MNFIFPSNYAFKNKLFGIIDYTTAIINLIWYIFIFCLVNILFQNINIKIFLCIILCLPFLIVRLIGINKEKIISVIIYISKFFKNSKIYFYQKGKCFKK